MILSSEELEILEYLKSWNGTSISIMEICRSAGGRKKFRESPHWAKSLMARLVEARMVTVNERGHYCVSPEAAPTVNNASAVPVIEGQAVGEDYFPVKEEQPALVGDDYFPSKEETVSEDETKIWMCPQIEEILRRAAKNLSGPMME